MSKIQDSISILVGLQLMIDECLDIIKSERHNRTSKIHAFINSQLVIYANSFIEEWEYLGTQCREDDRVLKVRKIALPFIRRIRQWKDLNALRNTFLAHSLRDKEKNNALIKEYHKELNIPNGFGDFMLLGGCIFCTKQILVTEFAVEYNEMLPYLRTIEPPLVKASKLDEDQALVELDRLIDQSEEIRLHHQKGD